jgi:hypothetical protein
MLQQGAAQPKRSTSYRLTGNELYKLSYHRGNQDYINKSRQTTMIAAPPYK